MPGVSMYSSNTMTGSRTRMSTEGRDLKEAGVEMPLMDSSQSDSRQVVWDSFPTRSRSRNSLRGSLASGGLAASMRGSMIPTLSPEDLCRQYATSIEKGLTSAQVKQNLTEYGYNELKTPEPTPLLLIWLKQLKDVIVLIILLAGLINIFGLDDPVAGGIMIMTFFGASLINAIGEWSTAEGGSALSRMSSGKATVMRDGKECEVFVREIVPGDIVHIKCGETACADMRVAQAVDLRMDESVLTGESQEVTKTDVASNRASLDPFPLQMIYSSTNCVSGRGVGIVTATGMNAQVGQIAEGLDIGVGDLSPLQKTMNRVGGSVGVGVFVIIGIITALCYLTGYQDPSKACRQGDDGCFFFTALSQGLILGVSMVPTTLPVMTTILLYVARGQIQSKQAEVRKTSTVETLGSCTAICSDKTGTLTEGKMTAIKVLLPRADAISSLAFYPTAGADPAGGIFRETELEAPGVKDSIDEIVSKSGKNFPLCNYGTAPTELNKDVDRYHVHTLLVAASINSYATKLERQNGKWTTAGNLSEGALVVAAAKAGIGPSCEELSLQPAFDTYPAEKDVELPFSSSRKMACTIHRVSGYFVGLRVPDDMTHVAIIKGAPDRLLPMVSYAIGTDADGKLVQLPTVPEDLVKRIAAENETMADDALRVLLLCFRFFSADDMQRYRSMETENQVGEVSQDLTVLGAFGISDPARSTVGPAIRKCQAAGIRVVMITGDQIATAAAIGVKLNICQNKAEAELCAALHDGDGFPLPDEEVDKMVLKTRVWARAQPSDKVTIVQALQRNGFITAMTGDGVNDAPALKLADIGTAMGITGTEVAKGSADIVLLNDDFSTIVDAVQEGRRTYANVQVYVTFYLALSLPEVITYAICMVGGYPLPITSLQVLLQSIVGQVVPPLLYCFQPIQEHAMRISPRPKDSHLLSRTVLIWFVLPWTIAWTIGWTGLNLVGLCMFTGFAHGLQIVGVDKYKAIDQRLATCEFALQRHRDERGYRIKDPAPFHCRCPIRAWPLASPRVLEQWGVSITRDEETCERDDEDCFSRERGRRGLANIKMVFGDYLTPMYDQNLSDALLHKCPPDDMHEGDHWCWTSSDMTLADKPLIDKDTNCGALGANVAHTMSFVGTVLAKLLLTIAASSTSSILHSWRLNYRLTIACVCSFSMCFLLVYLPVLVPVLKIPAMQPLPMATLLTTVTFSLVAHFFLDLCKVGYRTEQSRYIELREFHAKAINAGLLSAQASDQEIEAYREGHPDVFKNTI